MHTISILWKSGISSQKESVLCTLLTTERMQLKLIWPTQIVDNHHNPAVHLMSLYCNIVFVTEKTYEKATKHFLYAGIPDEYGHMLVEFATECGYPGEVELFIAQAVLQ